MVLRRGRGRESGQGTVEYGLLIASCAILVVVGVLFFAGGVDSLFRRAGEGAAQEPQVFTPPAATCDPSYEGVCVPPPPPDLDCDDLEQMGIPLPVTVVGDDPHKLDENGDGLGCAE